MWDRWLTANCISYPWTLRVLGWCIMPALLISKCRISKLLKILDWTSTISFKSDKSNSRGVNFPSGLRPLSFMIVWLAFSRDLQAITTWAFFSAKAFAV